MKNKKNINKEISATAVFSQPETAFETVNKYGTYEIQPTADTDNEYPQISAGLSKSKKGEKTCKK